MAEKVTPRSDPGKLMAGSGGGSLPKGGGGQFNLKKEPMYEIWSRRQGKKVATATSLKSATRTVDRRDNEYGAYDHYKKKIGEKSGYDNY